MDNPPRKAPESFLPLEFGANDYTQDGESFRFKFDEAAARPGRLSPLKSVPRGSIL